MARISTNRKGLGKKVYSIIVDGETEVWYFQLLKKHESLKNIDIKPDLPKKKKLGELYNLVKSHAADYSKVVWIIDYDTIIKENKERKKGEKSTILELNEYMDTLKLIDNVTVLINTPCLEFWYLLHLKETGKYFPNCDSVCKEFENTILKDYQKTEKYYKKNNNDIYYKLLAFQEKAIVNAEKLGCFDYKMPETAKAEIFKVFALIDLDK